jgi:hypothetical protein
MMIVRSYRELKRIESYEERFEYLRLKGAVGNATFGFDRYINQNFYRSAEWRRVRDEVIIRDNGCDMGVKGYDIHEKIIIHHMNPMTMAAIEEGAAEILDTDNLICVTHRTHNAIHYGNSELLIQPFVERQPNDTIPWK